MATRRKLTETTKLFFLRPTTMNGGKRARQKPSQTSGNLDENSCPNTMKRRKVDDDYLAKQNDPPKSPGENTQASTKTLILSDKPLDKNGIEVLNEDDSYESADDSETESPAKVCECTIYRQAPLSQKMVTPEHQTGGFRIAKRNRETGADNFNRLSDEIMLMIFRWLSKPMLCKTARVCRRWRQIVYDETLWMRLDLGSRTLNPRNLELVLKRGVSILRLAGAVIPDTVIKSPSSYLAPDFVSKLQYLDISMAQISSNGLFELLNICRHLRKLSLEVCVVNQSGCEAVGKNTNLETLNLSGCTGLPSKGLEAILRSCTQLVSLNVAWTSMDADTMKTLCTNIPASVSRLNVAGCRKNLTNEHVEMIVARCPNLVELDLSDCTIITGEAIDTIVKGLKCLEHLCLSRCYSIFPCDFEKLTDSLNLSYADIFGVVNDSNLLALKTSMPGIQLNKFQFSSIARPTTGVRRTSIWGLRCRD